MRFDKERHAVCLSVAELASYAYQRDNPKILEEKYGFVKNSILSDSSDHYAESNMSASRWGEAIHNIAETDSKQNISFVFSIISQVFHS